ncbi:MAG TPA: hypothetical protein PKA27_12945, partial [Fimbriimonadaceae bacterium]|nr:hypothetical protein [Fimbriimonadaceae bacterium]
TRPMITMFATGSGNAPRMVIGHSTSFSNYGLEYVDETDRFHFTGAGFRVVTVDLISGRLGIGAEAPESKIQVLDNAPSNDHGSLFVQNGSNGTLFPQTRIGAYISAMGTGSGTIAVVGAASEFASGSSYGGFFEALGIGDNFGVYGSAISGTQNFAGYFNGQVYGTSASAGVKSFLIDHPSDPENKLLRHSSVESDQRMNIYRGKVRTDERGYASVTVPDWFDGLNVDIQYSLTVVDGTDSSDFVLAKVARKLDKGVFVIRTSIPNTEVHWMLSGVRNDATSQRYPLVVEEDKPASLRGKYLEPEAHGYGVERAMYPPPQRKAANDDPAQKR